MNFQFGFLLWGVMEKAIQKHAGDQDSYCLTEHSRGWLKITHFLAQWQRFDSSTRLQIFTSARSNVWGNCSRSTEFNKDAKVTQKVGQTNKAVPRSMTKRQDSPDYILTFAFWRGAMRQHNTAEQLLQTSMNSFSCSLSARERLVPSTTSPCWITWSSFILFRDKKSWLSISVTGTFKFCYDLRSCPSINKEVRLLDRLLLQVCYCINK